MYTSLFHVNSICLEIPLCLEISLSLEVPPCLILIIPLALIADPGTERILEQDQQSAKIYPDLPFPGICNDL